MLHAINRRDETRAAGSDSRDNDTAARRKSDVGVVFRDRDLEDRVGRERLRGSRSGHIGADGGKERLLLQRRTCEDTACVAESMLPTTLLLAAAADAELLERCRLCDPLPQPPPGVSWDDEPVKRSSSGAANESMGGVEPSASSPPGRTCFIARRTP